MLLINFLDGTIKGFKEYQKFKIDKDKTTITIQLYETSNKQETINKKIILNSVESVRCDGNIIYVNVMAINNKVKNFN